MNPSKRRFGRRQFLKQTTAAAAVTASLRARAARAAEEKAATTRPAEKKVEPVRFAIAGVGNQGYMLLDQALKQKGAVCQAVCDIRPAQKEKALKLAGAGARGYESFDEMLDKEKGLQALILSTPLFLHGRQTLHALGAGLHIYCEKMMGMSIEECREMARAARRSGKVVQFGHHRHYDPYYITAEKIVNKDRALGEVTHIRAQWNRNGKANPLAKWVRPITDEDKRTDGGLLASSGYRSLAQLVNWRLYRAYSRGLSAELMSHQVDVANWFLRSRPVAVLGIGGIDTWKDGRETYDNIQCIFAYPGGVKLQYQSITTNEFDGFCEQFMGTDRTLITSTAGGALHRERHTVKLVWETDKPVTLKVCPTPPCPDGDGATDIFASYGLALDAFFDCIREGKEPACNAQVALDAAVACIRADEAMEKGTKVEIPASDYEI